MSNIFAETIGRHRFLVHTEFALEKSCFCALFEIPMVITFISLTLRCCLSSSFDNAITTAFSHEGQGNFFLFFCDGDVSLL